MDNYVGYFIAQKRKELGYTQQKLADKLNISFQAVSKWENGTSTPDIALLPHIARILNTSVDALVGYHPLPKTAYEEKYKDEKYYWGITPSKLCYEIMKLKPPIKPYRVLDIGCGEGKNAVFLAKNGYAVSAFDIAEAGLVKARKLAEHNHVEIDFFKADINDYMPLERFDIIFSSGVFHYLTPNLRKLFINQLKKCTSVHGINVINVFVNKPFIAEAPDLEDIEKQTEPWYSGELFHYYHDWLFHQNDETIFDCSSGGVPHKHCMDILIAEKMEEDQ
ncbi:MAG: methyltransferase domain-containing protein [Lachnospiraceae bacterium]|nr:methyltransferase domain-containing protein [Lachnospiraceae bacterium]